MDCCARTGRTQYHCGRCHVTFAALSSFDAHLIRAAASRAVTGCRVPGDMGLVQDDKGVWRTPEGLVQRDRRSVMLAALRTGS
jgi:hypothetical protein